MYKEPHTIGEELILPAAVDEPYDRWVFMLGFPHLL